MGIIAMKTQAGGYKTEALGKISPHQAALKWALQNTNVTMAIPGMKDMAQLREDIAVMGMPFQYADERILPFLSGPLLRPAPGHRCDDRWPDGPSRVRSCHRKEPPFGQRPAERAQRARGPRGREKERAVCRSTPPGV